MVKCTRCKREAADGFRQCLRCRELDAEASKKRVIARREKGMCRCGQPRVGNSVQCQRCLTRCTNANNANREAGLCHCGQPRLVNWSSCRRCHLSILYAWRRRHGFKIKDLYVAETAYGIKVGQSQAPSKRMYDLKYTMLAGLDSDVKFIKSYGERGHLEKLAQYELAEYCVRLPDGRLMHEIFSCDLATVFATIDRVIAEDLLSVSSTAAPSSGV